MIGVWESGVFFDDEAKASLTTPRAMLAGQAATISVDDVEHIRLQNKMGRRALGEACGAKLAKVLKSL